MTNDTNANGQANDLMPFTPDEMVQTPEQRARFEEAFSLMSSNAKISTVTLPPWDAKTAPAEAYEAMRLTSAELEDIRGVDQAENDGKSSGANDGK